jgi:hypothetical protein
MKDGIRDLVGKDVYRCAQAVHGAVPEGDVDERRPPVARE